MNPPTRGVLSYTPDEIERYMTLAHEHGFDVACHAIGDEANSVVLDAFEHTGATGAIEHAQLLKARDIPRLPLLWLCWILGLQWLRRCIELMMIDPPTRMSRR